MTLLNTSGVLVIVIVILLLWFMPRSLRRAPVGHNVESERPLISAERTTEDILASAGVLLNDSEAYQSSDHAMNPGTSLPSSAPPGAPAHRTSSMDEDPVEEESKSSLFSVFDPSSATGIAYIVALGSGLVALLCTLLTLAGVMSSWNWSIFFVMATVLAWATGRYGLVDSLRQKLSERVFGSDDDLDEDLEEEQEEDDSEDEEYALDEANEREEAEISFSVEDEQRNREATSISGASIPVRELSNSHVGFRRYAEPAPRRQATRPAPWEARPIAAEWGMSSRQSAAPIARPVASTARPVASTTRSVTPTARPVASTTRSVTPTAHPVAPAARSVAPTQVRRPQRPSRFQPIRRGSVLFDQESGDWLVHQPTSRSGASRVGQQEAPASRVQSPQARDSRTPEPSRKAFASREAAGFESSAPYTQPIPVQPIQERDILGDFSAPHVSASDVAPQTAAQPVIQRERSTVQNGQPVVRPARPALRPNQQVARPALRDGSSARSAQHPIQGPFPPIPAVVPEEVPLPDILDDSEFDALDIESLNNPSSKRSEVLSGSVSRHPGSGSSFAATGNTWKPVQLPKPLSSLHRKDQQK